MPARSQREPADDMSLAGKRATHSHLQARLSKLEKEHEQYIQAGLIVKQRTRGRHGCLVATGVGLVLVGLSKGNGTGTFVLIIGIILLAVIIGKALSQSGRRQRDLGTLETAHDTNEVEMAEIKSNMEMLEQEIDDYLARRRRE